MKGGNSTTINKNNIININNNLFSNKDLANGTFLLLTIFKQYNLKKAFSFIGTVNVLNLEIICIFGVIIFIFK